jgi:WD repeat and SOF domain-containing protein 1
MNPSVPPWLTRGTIGVPDGERDNATQGIGPTRTYIAPQAKPPHIQYPPRPIRGSIADLDIIHHYCDFNTNQVWNFLTIAPC